MLFKLTIKLHPAIRVYHQRDRAGACIELSPDQAIKLALELLQKAQQPPDNAADQVMP